MRGLAVVGGTQLTGGADAATKDGCRQPPLTWLRCMGGDGGVCCVERLLTVMTWTTRITARLGVVRLVESGYPTVLGGGNVVRFSFVTLLL